MIRLVGSSRAFVPRACGSKVIAVVGLRIPKTTFVKPAERKPGWYVLDVEGMIVGRVATQIATVLMGKHKACYTPHVDTGDYVVVVNADKVRFSGGQMVHKKHPYFTTKMAKKEYDFMTGFPSGNYLEPAIRLWEKHPEEILRLAVQRMLPKNALARHMLDKLKLCVGPNHPHQAQSPQPFPEVLVRRRTRSK